MGNDLGDGLQIFWIPDAGEKFIHRLLILIQLKDDHRVDVVGIVTEKYSR